MSRAHALAIALVALAAGCASRHNDIEAPPGYQAPPQHAPPGDCTGCRWMPLEQGPVCGRELTMDCGRASCAMTQFCDDACCAGDAGGP